jgi:hypothetical protein
MLSRSGYGPPHRPRLVTFVVLQMMRQSPGESVRTIKERWQLEVTRDGQLPPPPLKACPPHLLTAA